MPLQSTARVWALLGPHRGDNNQVLALAQALGLPFAEKRLTYNALRRVPPGLLGATFASVERASRAQIEGEPPDLTISVGLRAVPVVRELSRRSAGRMRSVHLGYPRVSPKHFDLVVTTPQYPVPKAPNVIEIPFALTPHRARLIEQSDRDLLDAYPRPRRLFLVGGPTLYWQLPPQSMRTAVDMLVAKAKVSGGSILAVGSPRTPVDSLEAIRLALEAAGVPFLFVPGDGPPAYVALIEAADEIYVTADSVSMTADAVMTGKPVGVIPIASSGLGRLMVRAMDVLGPGKRLRPRDLRFFWLALKEQGFGGTLDEPRASRPPDYAKLVAQQVSRLIADSRPSGSGQSEVD